MPLFVVDEKIENLKIDSFALPFCKELKEYYKTNYYKSKTLYEIYKSIQDKEKIKNITEQEKILVSQIREIEEINRNNIIEKKYRNRINPLIFKDRGFLPVLWEIYKKDVSEIFDSLAPEIRLLPEEQIYKELELLAKYHNEEDKIYKKEEECKNKLNKLYDQKYTLGSFNNKKIITFDFERKTYPSPCFAENDITYLYEKIIKAAYKEKISKIAIPIIDLHNMPSRNYYVERAVGMVRYLLRELKRDLTVYLILTDTNNDYCQDDEPENLYEKIVYLIRNYCLNKKAIEKLAKSEYKKRNHFAENQESEFLGEDSRYTNEDYVKLYYEWLIKDLTKKSKNLNDNRAEKLLNALDPNLKIIKYFDSNAFWERVNNGNTFYEIDSSEEYYLHRQNEVIKKNLGNELKKRINKKEKSPKKVACKNTSKLSNENSLNYDIDDINEEILSHINKPEESFSQMVLRKIKSTHRDRVVCYKAANVDKNIFSKIVKAASGDEKADGTLYVYKPDKKIVLAFAIALRLKKKEADELLRKAGYAFSDSLQDKIVKLFIQKGIYDIDIVNQFLFRFKQPLLGSSSR